MASVADDTIHKQSFSIDDLATRSVTLYPTRAAVVRDIENVTIKPGRNEITLHNLTPKADEYSIKVEGHGTSALITDMTVDLVPNYRFSNSPDSDSEDESDEEPPKSPELEQLTQDLKILRLQMDDADESRSSAMKQLHYLDQLTDGLSHSLSNTKVSASIRSVEEMSENLNHYSVHRERIYQAFKAAQATCTKLHEEFDEKTKKQLKAQATWDKSRQKADNAKEQRIRQKTHERRERQEQKLEVPRSVYRIKITIELESLPENTQVITSSVATGKPARKEDDEPPSSNGPSLRISYITGGASWTPRYDLRLDTISGTGTLTYRAHFFNRTGEVWRNAKLTLSTSQTSFTGLEDKVPWMDSWRITLRKRGTYGAEKDGGMYSAKEKELKKERLRKHKEEIDQADEHGLVYIPQNPEPKARASTGYPGAPPPVMLKFGQTSLSTLPEGQKQQQQPLSSRATNSASPHTVESTGALYSSGPLVWSRNSGSRGFGGGGSGGGGSGGGGSSGEKSKKRMSFVGSIKSKEGGYFKKGGDDSYYSDPSDDEDDAATLNPPQKMGLAVSSSESYGLTTTYDLPGLRTIPPSKLLRRHVITEINLPHVEFSHISVPKLRAAAFLKARVRNPSNTPLLRGPAGLTLDGSFLGNSTIPRCAPDDHFELGLGIDEEVLIEYRKPVRKVASQGMLVKEQVVTYERCVRIHNARGNLVKLVIFDQVPVSEDDRLKISVCKPRGLKNIGDLVRLGAGLSIAPTPAAGKHSSGAVTAGKDCVQAEMRKGGEIRWEASIEGGKDAVLPLEYEARLPSAEVIFGLGDASTSTVP